MAATRKRCPNGFRKNKTTGICDPKPKAASLKPKAASPKPKTANKPKAASPKPKTAKKPKTASPKPKATKKPKTATKKPKTATKKPKAASPKPKSRKAPRPVRHPAKIVQYLKNRASETHLGKMLKSVCKDPDNCIALGIYTDLVKHFFSDFSDFTMSKQPTRVGSISANGAVFSVPFVRHNYTAYAILKITASGNADNLYYEYYVGKHFINNYVRRFPCFVETYDVYRVSDSGWPKFMYAPKPPSDLSDLQPYEGSWSRSCVKNHTISVLIQHFPKTAFMSFKDMTANHWAFFHANCFSYFYQIYFALAVLGDTYTHYDLHYENACLYKPYADGYIEMHYHLNDGRTVSFPTEYIAKIIDYGRNYFNNGTTSTEKILQNKVCPAPECQPICGRSSGYDMIQGDFVNRIYGKPIVPPVLEHITPDRPNISHDLRLASTYVSVFTSQNIATGIKYDGIYGTAEEKCDEKHSIGIIHNLFDMRRALEDKYAEWKARIRTQSMKKMADMHIYEDGRDYEYNVV